jgi:hypothetical protein
MLADGRLHLSGIAKLAAHLTAANCSDLLARATHKTKAEIEGLIAEIAPKPDVPAAVRKIPVRIEAGGVHQLGPDRVGAPGATHELGLDRVAGTGAARELGLDRVAGTGTTHELGLDRVAGTPSASSPGPAMPRRADAASRPAAVTPLSPERYKVQFTASAELREKLERLQALTREDLAGVIEAAVTEKLVRLEAKRFGLSAAPRKSLAETDTSPHSRYLPAAVRRAVRRRDGERCSFVLLDGSRCPERRGLEFHHRHPCGRGGTHEPDNVCLRRLQRRAYGLRDKEYRRREVLSFKVLGLRVLSLTALRLMFQPLSSPRVMRNHPREPPKPLFFFKDGATREPERLPLRSTGRSTRCARAARFRRPSDRASSVARSMP